MAKIDVINQTGAVVDSIELNDAVFGIEPNQQAMYDVLVMALAGRRQGRARQGTIRAAQHRGGGTVFGAVPRDYHYRVNKKVSRLAVKSALSEKVADAAFTVVDKFDLDAPKTKTFVGIMEAINAPKKTLFVVANGEDATNAALSVRNIPNTKMLPSTGINVFDLVHANKVVMTSAAVKEIEEALA